MYEVSFCNPLSINQVWFSFPAVMSLCPLLLHPLHATKPALSRACQQLPQLSCHTSSGDDSLINLRTD